MRIIPERLHNQKLSSPDCKQAVDVVRWLGAVQAQDFPAAKWALALRMRAATDAVIQQAYDEGKILRTHLMRPTWHFVAPDDIRWLLDLTAPRVNANCGSAFRMFELDATVFKRTTKVLTKALQGGKHLTRAELRAVLNRSGVAADDGIRLGHIMIRAELDGVVCSGPRVGKQFTYALLEERVPATQPITLDEALAKLTTRYFTSHGPATLQDFVWWSGLTVKDAKRGVELIDRHLHSEVLNDKTYFFKHANSSPGSAVYPSHLLPAFDEYNVAYKHREAGLGPTVILDGKAVGTWKATTSKQMLTIAVTPSRALKKPETLAITQAANRYAAFLGLPAAVHI
ncbi:MAG TPA: winged helix DNA-binding domain-containing protein [Pyrinomonadaceae bacterium]|nr:winged helix DNA-binding domain-containing protein [Pyrinomonadaceae bacterium]